MEDGPEVVSVIVVSYNHSTSIAQCLDSILSQKTTYTFCVVVTDDASTDGTQDILKAYAKKYPNIRIILRDKNIGPGANFAAGLQTIQSKWIAYCDGDDHWCDDRKLQISLDALERNPDCTFFACNTRVHDVNRNKTRLMVRPIWKYFIINNRLRFFGPYTHISGRVFKNIPFPNYGDSHMYAYLLSQGPGYYSDKVMSFYNYNGKGNWSSRSKERQKQDSYTLIYDINKITLFKHEFLFALRYRLPFRYWALRLLKGKEKGWKEFLDSMQISHA